MNTDHPSTRITAAVVAGRATKARAIQLGCTDRIAHGLACLAAGLTRVCSPEMACAVALARAQSEQRRAVFDEKTERSYSRSAQLADFESDVRFWL